VEKMREEKLLKELSEAVITVNKVKSEEIAKRSSTKVLTLLA